MDSDVDVIAIGFLYCVAIIGIIVLTDRGCNRVHIQEMKQLEINAKRIEMGCVK